jgi:polyisoprenoid-binding protein YceI
MKKNSILLLCIGLLLSSVARSQSIITDADITFKIKNIGFNVDGSFSKSYIETDFSSENSSLWKLKGHVEVSTIDTDSKKRDEHLLKDDFFDAENHPLLSLQTKKFNKIADDLYSVEVELTIKNVTKTLKVPFRIVKTKTNEEFYAYFEINRKDFNVGGSSLVLSNTVKIRVEYNLKTN